MTFASKVCARFLHGRTKFVVGGLAVAVVVGYVAGRGGAATAADLRRLLASTKCDNTTTAENTSDAQSEGERNTAPARSWWFW